MLALQVFSLSKKKTKKKTCRRLPFLHYLSKIGKYWFHNHANNQFSRVSFLSDFFDRHHVKNTISVALRDGPGHRRLRVILLVCLYITVEGPAYGESPPFNPALHQIGNLTSTCARLIAYQKQTIFLCLQLELSHANRCIHTNANNVFF